ncbi:MAG: putative manganese-dependent inorganic diphosphatase [Treponema sp.]|nr:putative manganese-dependent inorganic diphosphatase [Treponema sp.]MDY5838396.1 putative manganese-dependent inorganic diphosphatase [Treponema sp.]
MSNKVYIIGHRNPDTDSVVAATAYARLKQLLGKKEYVAARAGKLAPQTEYIFKRFKLEAPEYIPDLIPRTEFYMNTNYETVDQDVPLWEAISTMINKNASVLPIVNVDGTYQGLLNYNAFALNSFKILNPKRDDIFLTSLQLVEKTLNATPIVQFDEEDCFKCTLMVGDDDPETFKKLLSEKQSENIIVITGDREDIQKLSIEAKVRALIITSDYVVSKDLIDLAKKNRVSIISGHDSTVATAMLIEYSSPVNSMVERALLPVKASDSVQKIRPLLSSSPSRCLPVVDDDYKVIGIIGESDLLHDANIQVILVDHNELQQAVEGIENYKILEIIDHHKVNTITTKTPIDFINKTVGSTSSIIANLYRENRVSIPKDIAAILLCGILSDTLILQSATTTEYDVLTAEYLSCITSLDIKELGNDIIKSGSHIGGRSADEVIHQDIKEYSEGKFKYTVSQIEVDGTQEILERKKEFLDKLEEERHSSGALFSALLVTDITKLSSIMFLANDEKMDSFINFPKQEDNIYYMKDVVSRKKQLIPLLTELIAEVSKY